MHISSEVQISLPKAWLVGLLAGWGPVLHQKIAFVGHFCIGNAVASSICLVCTNSHAIAVSSAFKIAIASGICSKNSVF